MDTKAIRVDTEAIIKAQVDESARLDRIEMQNIQILKQIALGGAATQPLQPVHTARRIPWDDIKFDEDEDGENVILGSGSFGTVYAATWCGVAVAAKTMSVKGAVP